MHHIRSLATDSAAVSIPRQHIRFRASEVTVVMLRHHSNSGTVRARRFPHCRRPGRTRSVGVNRWGHGTRCFAGRTGAATVMGNGGPLPVAAHAPQQTQQHSETRYENHDRRGVVETVQESTKRREKRSFKAPGIQLPCGPAPRRRRGKPVRGRFGFSRTKWSLHSHQICVMYYISS
jgi:hypothetical protein